MAIWPTAVAATLDLLTAVNNTKVTLTVDAAVGDTTLTVDDASQLPASGYLTFDDNATSPETISYTGRTTNNITGVSRGADGTTAASHSSAGSNTHIEQRWNAAYHNTLATEIIAVEQNLSDRFGTGTNIAVPSTRTFTLKATSNQLILGTTNTVTISSTAPSASRVYTLPDAGAAASFVLTTSVLVASTVAALDASKNIVSSATLINAAGYVIGTIVQTVTTTSMTQQTVTSTTFANASNWNATITPKASTHVIRATWTGFVAAGSANVQYYFTIKRGSTDLGAGTNGLSSIFASAAAIQTGITMVSYDSPASTSALTYGFYAKSASGSVFIGEGSAQISNRMILEEIAA